MHLKDLKRPRIMMPHEPRLPLVLRTTADVERLLANSRHVRKLPPSGLKIAIAGLDASMAANLSASIDTYVKACGCAAGGAFALVSLAAMAASLGLLISQRGPRWSDLPLLVLGVLLALLFGGLGKLFGLVLARWRFESRCRRVIRVLSRDQQPNEEDDRWPVANG